MSPKPGRVTQRGSAFCLMVGPKAGVDSVALHAGCVSTTATLPGRSAAKAEPDDSSAEATPPEPSAPSAKHRLAVRAVVVRRPNMISIPQQRLEIRWRKWCGHRA